MAAVPQNLAETGRRSSSSSRRANLSHGRGGAGTFPSISTASQLSPKLMTILAGNIGSTPSDLDPVNLETPTLKSEVYTTGRGGSGNMARNDDPAAARRAQDVVGYVLCTSCSPYPLAPSPPCLP